MSREEISAVFDHGCSGADVALIEGVRGLYEGAESIGDTGSSAAVAKILGIPVVLVVSSRSITRSAAALVKGFQAFDPDVNIRGVILNNVSGAQHIRKATEAIEHHCGIPVIGAVPRMPEMELSMRHLGLVPFLEGKADPGFGEKIGKVTGIIGDHVNLDLLLSLSSPAVAMPGPADQIFHARTPSDIRIGVAIDEAFNFYYADLFDLLWADGAVPVPFSPLRDSLPDADGYIIGGGYPELFLPDLEGNASLRESVQNRCAEGIPVYAECGGLMYLTEMVCLKAGWQERKTDERYKMCGVFSGETFMPARRVVSYVEGDSLGESPLGPGHFRGHEFHYSNVLLSKDTKYTFSLSRGQGIQDSLDGALKNNTIGSYTHLHPVSSRRMFRSFIAACRRFGTGR